MKFDLDVSTTFNVQNPVFSRHRTNTLYNLQVAEDSIFTLGGKLEQATKEVFIPRAKGYAPKRSGALADSIDGSVELANTQIYIGLVATEPYAGFVEFGTSRSNPRPFMRPALYEAYSSILGASVVRNQIIPSIKIWKHGSKKWKR